MCVDSCPFLLRVRAPRRSAASRRDEVDLDDRAVEHDAGGRNDGHDRWLRHHATIDAFEAAIVLGVEQVDFSREDVPEPGTIGRLATSEVTDELTRSDHVVLAR